MNTWPFSDSPDTAVFTIQGIVFEGDWIAYVTHDADDGYWQFHNGQNVDLSDAAVVTLGEIVALDQSLMELADLPLGWQASRTSKNSAWVRSKKP